MRHFGHFAQLVKRLDAGTLVRVSLIGCVLGAAASSCQQQTAQEGQKRVEEIPISGSFSNAELIRNPVSLKDGTTEMAAVITFADTLFHFGTVDEGEQVERTFTFSNTGKGPLLISRAYSTCGCTVPEWPEAPIPPGEKGAIKVRFDTQGRTGQQLKPVTITANTSPATVKVYLAGEVRPAGK